MRFNIVKFTLLKKTSDQKSRADIIDTNYMWFVKKITFSKKNY